MTRGGRQSPAERLEAAEKNLEGAKQHQKDLRELRGMPGYKKALGTSADNIRKAEKAVKAAKREVERG